jgi:alkyl sulfatase BDS1-like metallo-beta-lactamase superfamily hydrolase
MSEGTEAKGASDATREVLARAAESLPAENDDAKNAERGFVGGPDSLVIRDSDGRVAWDMDSYGFLRDGSDEAPDTVHPSLWRHARIDTRPGLYEVCDGVYQVRGYDVSNMTLVEGERGVVVVDPLISVECARAALELYFEHRGEREVTALVYSHSHADHFGGAKGVVDPERVAAGEVQVYAPDRFLIEAVSENVLAGNAMVRRGGFMFGNFLERGPRGQLGSGIGWTSSDGTFSLIPPTVDVAHTGQSEDIDGVRFVFQLVPETEAPAELNFHLPDRGALYVAEIATHTHHNVLTLRGAQVRDALGWSKYLNEAIELFGAESEVLFHGHHWPTWGREELGEFLKAHRDLYRYIHDQTLRLMNRGLTPTEIATEVEVPPSARAHWSCRGYYGTVSHNVRAVYQRYLGFFDGVPAHLDPLPPTELGRRYAELAGGADALLAKAREAFEAGDYRWAAELGHHLVFADPEDREAREVEADALEQMGYQAESAIWRNYYLTGALELRSGRQETRDVVAQGRDVARNLPVDMVFDAMGSRLNARRAAGKRIVINWDFTDLGERWVMTVENSALSTVLGRLDDGADATITLTRSALDSLILGGPATALKEYITRQVKLSGNRRKLLELLGLFELPDPGFDVVTP